MVCIYLKNTNPFFCLAAEEYLLKNYTEDIFLLWQSHDAVIVGKHQNAMAEINYQFVRENHIVIARRITGGGTVFHDAGNVNFTFIKNVSGPSEISFKKFTDPVIEFLGNLGVKAETSGRNDILVCGKKVSGNAEHVFKNRVLHHGTLLFDTELENLGNAIRVVPGKYIGKAVGSNRSQVTNIRPFLINDLDTKSFIENFYEFMLLNQGYSTLSFSQSEIDLVDNLAKEKFAAWEWRFGYSPAYLFKNKWISHNYSLLIEFQVEKGIIVESRCTGTGYVTSLINDFNRNLSGKKHWFEEIYPVLNTCYPEITELIIYSFF